MSMSRDILSRLMAEEKIEPWEHQELLISMEGLLFYVEESERLTEELEEALAERDDAREELEEVEEELDKRNGELRERDALRR